MNVIKAGLGVMKKALPLSFTWKSSEEVPLPREEEGGEGEEGGEEGEDGEEKDEGMDEDKEQYEEDEDQYDEDDLIITAQPHTPVPRNLVSDNIHVIFALPSLATRYYRVPS